MLKIAYHPAYTHTLPRGHRFPMMKYKLLPEQLLYEGTAEQVSFFEPKPAKESHILLTHTQVYWHQLKNLNLTRSEERKMGFPLSRELIERELIISQGTIDACEYALKYGIAMNIAGGTHHAFSNRGEGFCLLNDQAMAARILLKKYHFKQILIVDLDVHQGNGTAEIFHDEPRVFTFSIHGAKNYPLQKEKSDLDVPLPNSINDKIYLELLNMYLSELIDQLSPEFIFFQSGVDVLATDRLGKLSLSIAGCKQRDMIVLDLCKKNNIPLVVCMGGGYSAELRHIIEAHANTYRLAQEIFF